MICNENASVCRLLKMCQQAESLEATLLWHEIMFSGSLKYNYTLLSCEGLIVNHVPDFCGCLSARL